MHNCYDYYYSPLFCVSFPLHTILHIKFYRALIAAWPLLALQAVKHLVDVLQSQMMFSLEGQNPVWEEITCTYEGLHGRDYNGRNSWYQCLELLFVFSS